MRTLSFAVLATLALIAGCRSAPRPAAPRGEPVFRLEGRVENGPFLFGAADLAALPRLSFRAREPVTGRTATFEGPSVAAMVTTVAEPKRDADTLTVHGENGYAVAVPLIAVKQLKPVLAERADGRPIAEWLREGGTPTAAPLLAWPNVDAPGLDTDPRARSWWVAGVTAATVDSWDRTYGRALRVPPGADDDARLGAGAITVDCLTCHRVRGVGGTRGPDLTDALHGKTEQTFVSQIRAHARAVDGPRALEGGDESLRRIASFLEAIETAGPPPTEDRPDEPKDEPAPGDRTTGQR